MNFAYIIFLIICGFSGFVCAKADINPNDWRFWAIMFSVIGTYICGRCY